MKQNGITYGSSVKRTTLRTNIETKAKDWLKFGIAQSIGFSENSANRFADTRSNNVNSPLNCSSQLATLLGTLLNEEYAPGMGH